MLSIGKMGKRQANYYLGLAREDYYREGGEPPGIWYGRGAEALGLIGTVEAAELRRLFEGWHPREERPLIELQMGKDHRPGWDLTFSAPKSVSALWSQAPPEVRDAIQAAHFASVRCALNYMEGHIEVARRGKGGFRHETAHLVVATFEHGTSRAQDPQLHSHCLVMNVCQRADGAFRTLDGKPLLESKMLAGALYRAQLASELETRLSLGVERVGRCFEVQGVSSVLLREFSKRRAEIEKALEGYGYDSPKAAAMATLTTRQGKEHAPREALFAGWQETGQLLGWGPDQAKALLERSHAPIRNPEAEKAEAISLVMRRLGEPNVDFTGRDFLRYVAEEAPGRGIDAATVLATGWAHLTGSPDVVVLAERKRGETVYRTQETVEAERALSARVDTGQRRHSPGVSEAVLRGVIGSRQAAGKLNDEQAAALRHLCASGAGEVRILSGMAGDDRTALLDAARFAWELEGFEVRGAAVSERAVERLADGARIPAKTLSGTLQDIEQGKQKLYPRSVLVVDEIGRVEAGQLQQLLERAERSGSRLVLLADREQAQRGERDRRVRTDSQMPNLQQIEIWAKGIVYDVAAERFERRLAARAENGSLRVAEDRRGAYRELIDAWKSLGVRAPKDCLILAPTRSDEDALNQMAQEGRKRAGQLGVEGVPIPEGGVYFYVGDRVHFTRKSRVLGVENGSFGEIVAVERKAGRVTTRLDSGDRVTVTLTEYPHLRLGYAVANHGHKATAENTFILIGAAQDGNREPLPESGVAYLFADRQTTGDKLLQRVNQHRRDRDVPQQNEVAQAVQTVPPKIRPTREGLAREGQSPSF